jgi:hypothetical protein
MDFIIFTIPLVVKNALIQFCCAVHRLNAENPHQYRKNISINAGFVRSASGGGRDKRLIGKMSMGFSAQGNGSLLVSAFADGLAVGMHTFHLAVPVRTIRYLPHYITICKRKILPAFPMISSERLDVV